MRVPHGVCADNAAKTHCIHGHEFTDANTYRHIDPAGRRGPRRQCRRCGADRAARYWREAALSAPKKVAAQQGGIHVR